MYTRVSRSFSILSRQWTKKLCKNTKSNVPNTIVCYPNIKPRSAVTNVFVRRDFCDKNSSETEISVPTRLAPDEEAEKWLEDFLKVPENDRMRKIIELEIEVLRQNGDKVPDTLKPRHWFELLKLESRPKRKRFLAFVFGIEKKKEHQRDIKIMKQQERLERGMPDNNYILGRNSMYLRFYESTMNRMWHGRVMNSIMYGQPIVLDCSYESHMTNREQKYCAKQLNFCFAENRIHEEPYNIYMCNVDLTSLTTKCLHRLIPTLFDDDYPVNITTQSYLDFFDKDRLVYLTPHCREEMTAYDHDAVYIIGAFIDKASNEPVSLAKAKKLGLKTLKLPLDKYLRWGCSSGKNLTLNAVMNILRDVKFTGSWEKALQHVPRRKLAEYREAAEERKLRKILESNNSFGENSNENSEKEQRIVYRDESMPLQMPRIKVPPSYNNNPLRSKKSRPQFSFFDKNDSEISNESIDDQTDFSMEARAKLKKKSWKS